MKKTDRRAEKPSVPTILEARARMAAIEASKLDAATVPVFLMIEPRRTPQQVGSGVLVKIKRQVFILSASHVFEVPLTRKAESPYDR